MALQCTCEFAKRTLVVNDGFDAILILVLKSSFRSFPLVIILLIHIFLAFSTFILWLVHYWIIFFLFFTFPPSGSWKSFRFTSESAGSARSDLSFQFRVVGGFFAVDGEVKGSRCMKCRFTWTSESWSSFPSAFSGPDPGVEPGASLVVPWQSSRVGDMLNLELQVLSVPFCSSNPCSRIYIPGDVNRKIDCSASTLTAYFTLTAYS